MAKQNRTQEFVPIKEIKDGVVIRDDGTFCAVLLTTAINFGLKSQDEQDATLIQFQNVLNALEIQTQIVVQSRNLDVGPYLDYLDEFSKKSRKPTATITN